MADQAAREVAGVAPCEHHALTVDHEAGGTPTDDHSVEWGQCPNCKEWIVRTVWLNRERDDCVEDRPMTIAERTTLQLLEARYRTEDV
jgi:hypothetical protein